MCQKNPSVFVWILFCLGVPASAKSSSGPGSSETSRSLWPYSLLRQAFEANRFASPDYLSGSHLYYPSHFLLTSQKKIMARLFSILAIVCVFSSLSAQDKPLSYYLPDIKYDNSITTPKEYLGWQIGDWHISHDLLIGYMREIAAQTDRVYIGEYARSHEGRPLMGLVTVSYTHLTLPTILLV